MEGSESERVPVRLVSDIVSTFFFLFAQQFSLSLLFSTLSLVFIKKQIGVYKKRKYDAGYHCVIFFFLFCVMSWIL